MENQVAELHKQVAKVVQLLERKGEFKRQRNRLPVWDDDEDCWWRRRRRSFREDWPPNVRAFFDSSPEIRNDNTDSETAISNVDMGTATELNTASSDPSQPLPLWKPPKPPDPEELPLKRKHLPVSMGGRGRDALSVTPWVDNGVDVNDDNIQPHDSPLSPKPISGNPQSASKPLVSGSWVATTRESEQEFQPLVGKNVFGRGERRMYEEHSVMTDSRVPRIEKGPPPPPKPPDSWLAPAATTRKREAEVGREWRDLKEPTRGTIAPIQPSGSAADEPSLEGDGSEAQETKVAAEPLLARSFEVSGRKEAGLWGGQRGLEFGVLGLGQPRTQTWKCWGVQGYGSLQLKSQAQLRTQTECVVAETHSPFKLIGQSHSLIINSHGVGVESEEQNDKYKERAEEKSAPHYAKLTRRGEGVTRIMQGLSFSSSTSNNGDDIDSEDDNSESNHELSMCLMDIGRSTCTNLNKLISQDMSSLTTSLWIDETINEDIIGFQTYLVPYPCLHSILPLYAPVILAAKTYREQLSILEIINLVFEPSSMMTKCNPEHGKYKDCCLRYCGNIVSKLIKAASATIKTKRIVQYFDWYPTGFKWTFNTQVGQEERESMSSHLKQWDPGIFDYIAMTNPTIFKTWDPERGSFFCSNIVL